MGKQLSGPRDLRLISMYLAYDCGEAYMESPFLRTGPAQGLQHRDRMLFSVVIAAARIAPSHWDEDDDFGAPGTRSET
jgi:hypothetical protein